MKNKFNIVIPDEEKDKSKSFLDKLATFAIDRVRKTLMPLLIKKFTPKKSDQLKNNGQVVSKDSENFLEENHIGDNSNAVEGKKRNMSDDDNKPMKHKKRNRNGIRGIAFDPEIHVKKVDADIDLTPMIENVTVTDKELQEHGTPVSSVTPGDIPNENTRIRNIVHKFFTNDESGELHFKTYEEFVTFIDIQQGDESTEMPPLVSGGSQSTNNVVLSELDTHLEPTSDVNAEGTDGNGHNDVVEHSETIEQGNTDNGRNIQAMTENEGEPQKRCSLRKAWKPKKCGGCTFDAEKETYSASLRKNYGCKLRCAGENCGKYLEIIMKEKGNGAMVCNSCRSKQCEMMYCNKCYTDLGVTSKRRGGRTKK